MGLIFHARATILLVSIKDNSSFFLFSTFSTPILISFLWKYTSWFNDTMSNCMVSVFWKLSVLLFYYFFTRKRINKIFAKFESFWHLRNAELVFHFQMRFQIFLILKNTYLMRILLRQVKNQLPTWLIWTMNWVPMFHQQIFCWILSLSIPKRN